jgi:lipoprotein-anchoring transpeptidase ErfK/SrfK
MRWLACPLAIAALALPGVAQAAPEKPDPGGPARAGSWIAKVMTPTVGRAAPRANARTVQRIGTTAPWAGGAVQLMVLGSQRDADDVLWLQVQLAKRPNGSTAWVLADHVRLLRTTWRIEVATASRTVTVRRAGKLVRRYRAVVGAPGTPTPRGLFAVAERFDLANANNFYGPNVLALTAFSSVFETFGGGPGVVGIHGRGGASLATPLGTAASHGCVRIDNAQIVFLARVAIAGTPVSIT